ncbi:MAG: 2OG-Fe(II) oxygenase [Polyangiaceae bacterium]|nr:2OG-Fe(II) oxygenase [Polyangiaceae bacterium]
MQDRQHALRAASFASSSDATALERRIDDVDWSAAVEELDERGYAVMRGLLRRRECEAIVSLYDDRDRFRSCVVMERHGFGRGEYRYFDYPLPEQVSDLRTALYAKLAPIANEWHGRMRIEARFPLELAELTSQCHAAGQRKPTPLMLRYGPEDYCCLHQDLYGKMVFPFQVVFPLSQRGRDFDGGEFLLADTGSRGADRAEVVSLDQGDAMVFAVNHRPGRGSRGVRRIGMRHGVSKLHRGARYSLGVIFHDG